MRCLDLPNYIVMGHVMLIDALHRHLKHRLHFWVAADEGGGGRKANSPESCLNVKTATGICIKRARAFGCRVSPLRHPKKQFQNFSGFRVRFSPRNVLYSVQLRPVALPRAAGSCSLTTSETGGDLLGLPPQPSARLRLIQTINSVHTDRLNHS